MGSGMGNASIGIYSYELFKKYDVDRIIRIGTTGSYVKELNVYDVVLLDSCYSDSSYAWVQARVKDNVMYPSEELNEIIRRSAKKLGIEISEKRAYSSDVYIREAVAQNTDEIIHDKHCSCVEMESFALFHNAKVLNKQAACLLTVSDSMVTNEKTSSEEREKSFDNMMKIALQVVL